MPVFHPRCWITVGGGRIPCISATVHRKAQRSANTFTAVVSITESKRFGMDFAAWAQLEETEASVQMALDSNSRTMMSGTIDRPKIHVMKNTVTVSGRDKAAKLINLKINKEYKNKTAGEIVEDIAKKAGLSAKVSGGDSDKAGKTYVEDTMHLIADKSAFAAISGLADREGARWYVDGDTLYFEPDENGGSTFRITYSPPPNANGNILDLHLARNMEAARPHKVTVKAWHRKDKRVYETTKQADGVGDPVEFEHHHNGHKQKQVETVAKSRLKNAIRHEMQMIARMHADLSVDVRQKVTLSGTGSIYDQDYDIDSAVFNVSWEVGAEMELDCKSPKQGRGDGE